MQSKMANAYEKKLHIDLWNFQQHGICDILHHKQLQCWYCNKDLDEHILENLIDSKWVWYS